MSKLKKTLIGILAAAGLGALLHRIYEPEKIKPLQSQTTDIWPYESNFFMEYFQKLKPNFIKNYSELENQYNNIVANHNYKIIINFNKNVDKFIGCIKEVKDFAEKDYKRDINTDKGLHKYVDSLSDFFKYLDEYEKNLNEKYEVINAIYSRSSNKAEKQNLEQIIKSVKKPLKKIKVIRSNLIYWFNLAQQQDRVFH